MTFDEQVEKEAEDHMQIKAERMAETGENIELDEIEEAFKSGAHLGRTLALQSEEVRGLVYALETAIKQMEYTDLLDTTKNQTNEPTLAIFCRPALAAFDAAVKK